MGHDYRSPKANGFQNKPKKWTCKVCGNTYSWTGWGIEPDTCANCSDKDGLFGKEDKKRV